MIADRRKTLRRDKEAAAWFTLLSDTEVESDALERFDRWIQRDGNRAAYQRIEDISSTAEGLREDPELRAAAREALNRKPPKRRALQTNFFRPTPRIWGGLALAGVLASAVTIFILAQPKTYQTDVGGRQSVQLTDGSTVQLNTDTRLRVRFSRGARRLELLKGQAFFDVAHDTARPFIVQAGAMDVRAVGTRFDVRKDGRQASVVLAQGQVRVSQEDAPSRAWTLSPGQAITLRVGAHGAVPASVDVAAQTSWTQNIITFHDVALSDAVAEINRYQRGKITLAPGVPARARLSGVFTTGDQEEFLDAAKASFDLEGRRRSDGGIELRPRLNGS